MAGKSRGDLIIIGGHEDKKGDMVILKEVARRAIEGNGHIVIIAAATYQDPEETVADYTRVFTKLQVPHIDSLAVRSRQDAYKEENVEIIKKAKVLFSSGGDQLRITSMLGDSPVFQAVEEACEGGCTIAGTSAGAAVMSTTMLVAGPSDESNRIDSIDMAPGLGLLNGVVIDSHFAERGRMGRLLGAVAQNPANIGVGIDENTAIIVHQEKEFEVMGESSVYVVDGSGLSYTSLSEENPRGALSLFDVKLHVLTEGDRYDLTKRQPMRNDGKKINPSETPTMAERQSGDKKQGPKQAQAAATDGRGH